MEHDALYIGKDSYRRPFVLVFIWFAHTIKGGKALEPIKEFPDKMLKQS